MVANILYCRHGGYHNSSFSTCSPEKMAIKLNLFVGIRVLWVNGSIESSLPRRVFFLQREFSFILLHFGGCF